MTNVKFYPTDGRHGVEVTSMNDIKSNMGDVVGSFGDIEIIGNLVASYMNGLPVTLGRLQEH